MEFYKNRAKNISNINDNSAQSQPIVETKTAVIHQSIADETPIEVENIQKQPTIDKPKKILARKDSLGSMLNELKTIDVKEVEKLDFIQANVEQLWTEFIEFIKPKAQSSFLNIAQSQTPKIDGNKLILEVSSNINLEMIQFHKTDIIGFFISNTNTKLIELVIELNRKEEEISNYKQPKDRLKEMVEENNVVRYMITKLYLNLDI